MHDIQPGVEPPPARLLARQQELRPDRYTLVFFSLICVSAQVQSLLHTLCDETEVAELELRVSLRAEWSLCPDRCRCQPGNFIHAFMHTKLPNVHAVRKAWV